MAYKEFDEKKDLKATNESVEEQMEAQGKIYQI
jgi:hypothetical protein